LNLLATTRPGDKVALTVVRSGNRLQFKMTVGVRPAGMEAPT
jgi:S1-C subfamily serine protease